MLTTLVLIPFFIWGDVLLAMFDQEGARAWIQARGAWGMAALFLLLVADLFLPIPATCVMSAAGYTYGIFPGAILSLAGSTSAGVLAYGLCRTLGRRAARHLAGLDALEKNEHLFLRNGIWLVALSRWLPVLPEVVSCLAGLGKMRFPHFLAALLCGTLPMSFIYATVGALFDSEPLWALALSITLPPVFWLFARPFLKPRSEPPSRSHPSSDPSSNP